MKLKQTLQLSLVRNEDDLVKDYNDPENCGIHGELSFEDETGVHHFRTLENLKYLIVPGKYRLAKHYWRKYKEWVPELLLVPATELYPAYDGSTSGMRAGILIHGGCTPRNSHGCILIPYRTFIDHLVGLIDTYEKVYLTVSNGCIDPHDLVQP